MKKWGGEDQDPKRVKGKDKEKLNPRRGENFVERLVNPTERWNGLGSERRPLDWGTEAFFLTLSLNRFTS